MILTSSSLGVEWVVAARTEEKERGGRRALKLKVQPEDLLAQPTVGSITCWVGLPWPAMHKRRSLGAH